MATIYNSDDTFNVIEDHIKQALAADTKLGTGGVQEIKTFEQEHRDDFSSFIESELPAISIEVRVQAAPTEIAIGDLVEYSYGAQIFIITVGAAKLDKTKSDLKYYAARVTRVLQQQHYPDKQLVSLPDDLDGADGQGVKVVVQSIDVIGDVVSVRNPNVLRGLAEILAVVTVTITMPED